MQTYGEYRLERRIAFGGMAEIFLAERKGVQGFAKKVVLKRILPHLASEPEFVKMFVHEAKLASSLVHPNIVQVHDLGEAAGALFIAMEYVPGSNLGALHKEIARAEERFPMAAALTIGIETARGLHYAHEKRNAAGTSLDVVHRDVSPQNILLSNEGLVKITDFGIAKAVGATVKTRTGSIKGKFAYMSPEQALQEPIDRRSDIFSLGIVLYEILAQRRLYRGSEEWHVLDQARLADIPPLDKEAPEVPLAVAQVVMKALARAPKDRYATAAEMASALQQAAAGATMSSEELGALVRRFERKTPPAVDLLTPSPETVVELRAPPPKPLDLGPNPPAPLPVKRILLATAGAMALIVWYQVTRPAMGPLAVTPPSPASVPVLVASQPALAPAETVPVEARSPVAAKIGYLTLNSQPWSNVYIDGALVKQTPLERFPVKAGTHRVRFVCPGLAKTEELVIEVAAGKHATKIVRFSP